MFDFDHKNATEIQTIATFDSEYYFDCFYLILYFLEIFASLMYNISERKIYKNAITGCKTEKSCSASQCYSQKFLFYYLKLKNIKIPL